VAANDIAATINFMNRQPFVAGDNTIVVGISTGGWASLALAARNPSSVRAIVNFAGGRGGHAYGRDNALCGVAQLLSAARIYGASARVPTVWFYSENDSYFGPQLAQRLARVWRAGGGAVEKHVLPPYGSDGHEIADDRAGWDLWGASLESFLLRTPGAIQPGIEVASGAGPGRRASSALTGASLGK
jgi:dienelactone hydrolase